MIYEVMPGRRVFKLEEDKYFSEGEQVELPEEKGSRLVTKGTLKIFVELPLSVEPVLEVKSPLPEEKVEVQEEVQSKKKKRGKSFEEIEIISEETD